LSLADKQIKIDLLQWKDRLVTTQTVGKTYIYDPIRKKKVVLQPEELVRQLMIQWLIHETNFNRNNIQVEKKIKINNRNRRFDIVLYNKNTIPYILVECKSPEVQITQITFDQIAVYNMALRAPFLIVTNGLATYCVELDHIQKSYIFLSNIPERLS